MKNLSIFIAGVAFMLLTVSAFIGNHSEAVLGEQAPALVVKRNDTTLNLSALKGKWVILSFWSAADAPSRMAQNEVAAFLGSGFKPAGGNDLQLVSVNFDSSERLMREIVKIDNLYENTQFRIEDASMADAALEAYRMKDGLRTFLINPEGVLVKADPTVSDMKEIMG